MKNIAGFFLMVFFLISCSSQKTITLSDLSQLKFINEYDVPYNKIFRNTTIGGLSGIDYDARHDRYYLISDDRSSINPARFYTAAIHLSEKGIDSVQFTAVKNLLQASGRVYPGSKQDPYHTPDPEAMRYDPKTNRLVWSSEGERIIRTIPLCWKILL